jgi:hypothetical protein
MLPDRISCAIDQAPDLLSRKVFEIGQVDNGALTLRKLFHAQGYGGKFLLSQQCVERRAVRIDRVLRRLTWIFSPATAAAQQVARQVVCNAENIGHELGVALKTVRVPPQLHRRFVQYLFRVLPIAEPVHGEQEYPAIDGAKELDKRLLVALPDSVEQPNGGATGDSMRFIHDRESLRLLVSLGAGVAPIRLSLVQGLD